jgi:hypothetical protein
MPKPIHLYVSSSPDLAVEREIVAQVVAALPLTIGWRIGHTPLPGQLESPDAIHVEEADLYAVILGHDYAAPMGQELRLVLGLGRAPFAAYRGEYTPSPSAQDAVRTLDLTWHRYSSPGGFRSMFRRDLHQAVLEQAPALGLHLGEVRRLLQRSDEAEAAREDPQQVDRQREDAGRSGSILGREVWEAED